MKHKLWSTKNSFGGRTLVSKDIQSSKETLMLGHRATLYGHENNSSATISYPKDGSIVKQSKFDELKKQIKNLENSQFLCMKYRCNTEPDSYEDVQFRLTGKEFMPSKKITQLERYKLHLRKKGKKRKISLLLDKTPFQEVKDINNRVSFLDVQDVNINQNNYRENSLKKKETPSIVRKYYRPQTGVNHRSMSELGKKQNEVRGRSLKSSASNRVQKQNFIIYIDMSFAGEQANKIFKEEDLQQLIRHVFIGKGFNMDKVTKRIYVQMAQTFIEEVLDLPPSEKSSITKEAINRQIAIKFPEISRDSTNVEILQRRNMEIEKEDIM